MRRAADFLTASRLPLPADDAERLRLAQRTTAILVAVAGALTLVIVPMAVVAKLPGFHPAGVVVPAGAALVGAPLLARVRLTWKRLYGLLLGSTGMISGGVYSAGPRYPLGVVLYLWVVVVGFLFFSRRQAGAVTVLVALEYAAIMTLVRGYGAPVVQWLYLVVTAVVTGVVLDWLVGRTRSLAEAEREARVALQTAHHELELVLSDREALNRTLEERVDKQVRELASLGELRRFLSPQVADTMLQEGGPDLLAPHRRDISVLFVDLRGFTAFTSEVEPEEVMAVLAEYYDCVGALLRRFEATIGPLSGDGLMAYFNDPLPCADPAHKSVELALELQEGVDKIRVQWAARGHDLGCGVGVASGFATLGLIGFEGKRDYGPMGSVVNRAARLCDKAEAGQILVDAAIKRQLGATIPAEALAEMTLKGFPRPVPVFAVNRDASPLSER